MEYTLEQFLAFTTSLAHYPNTDKMIRSVCGTLACSSVRATRILRHYCRKYGLIEPPLGNVWANIWKVDIVGEGDFCCDLEGNKVPHDLFK